MKTQLKWFRFETKCQHLKEPFVDWYHGPIEVAKANHDEDCNRYGLNNYTVTIREATDAENDRMNEE